MTKPRAVPALGVSQATPMELELSKWKRSHAEIMERLQEALEVIDLWEQHGMLHGNEDCDGCRRVETYRVTGFLDPPNAVGPAKRATARRSAHGRRA